MSHVPYPFNSEGVLLFSNPSDDNFYMVKTEIAQSKVEIFQSWCYRENDDPLNYLDSLTLLFPDPARQYLVMFEYDFDVTVIMVDTDGKINAVYDVWKHYYQGDFIKTFIMYP